MGNNMFTIIKKREKVMNKLLGQWDQYNEIKDDLAFGVKPINKDKIIKLLKDSYLAIRDFRDVLLLDDNFKAAAAQMNLSHLAPVERLLISNYILDYSELISKLAIFTRENYRDESENYFFSVWQVITRLLFFYAHYHCIIIPMDVDGVLCGDYEDCGMYRPADDDDDEFWDKDFHYDVETGDISEILELVKRASK